MPLATFRRHTRTCTAGRPEYDRAYWRCRCPISVEGMLGGEYIRKSLKTTNRELAHRLVTEAEGRGYWDGASREKTTERSIAGSVQAFLKEAASEKGRALAAPTLSKYRTLFGRLDAFCRTHRLISLDDLTPERLRLFKETWPTGPRATGNNIARLKSFFRFCLENEWITRNPALALRRAKHIAETQKLPFLDDEMDRILLAARETTESLVINFLLETLILVMRCTGLRISDAAMLKADRIHGEELGLRTTKSGTWVSMPIEPQLLTRLERIKPRADGYLFVTGTSVLMSSVTEFWRRRINRVFSTAGIAGGHPHRFRHTFAVDLLAKGTDVKHVSILLGHSSVTVTERYYSAWIPKRQEVLNEEVRRSWGKSPAALLARKPPGSARPEDWRVRCINQ